MRQILITKANGVMEPFDVKKLEHSLYRSGATADQVSEVVTKIIKTIQSGDSTSEIYREAFQILKKLEKSVAARYSLRKSLAQLGPSGFPFEIFISRVFESLGYVVKVGMHLKGKCIEHEVDLVAWNDTEFIMGEVKFHNNSDLKNDAKTIMYIHSRYEDLRRSRFDNRQSKNQTEQGWLITNTKFTETTIKYAGCYGLKLLGWNYPYGGRSLQNIIEENKLEPITMLTTLTDEDKRLLLDNNIVLCESLTDRPEVLRKMGVPKERIIQAMTELKKIQSGGHDLIRD